MNPFLSFFLSALAVLAIPACTNVPLEHRLPHESASAETLFLQSFQELPQNGKSSALKRLHQDFPESIWTRKADDLAELYSSRREIESRLGELKTRLRACETAKHRRQEKIDQLKRDLQRLNDVVIEMELRSK